MKGGGGAGRTAPGEGGLGGARRGSSDPPLALWDPPWTPSASVGWIASASTIERARARAAARRASVECPSLARGTLEAEMSEPKADASSASRAREVVVEGSARGFAQTIRVGRHLLAADEPVEVGGGDTGPGPYDLLLAALGACTSMTVAMYARRKEWPLEAVRVRLRHSKIHAEDCASCETKVGMLDRIERDLEFEGRLDEEQRARLLEIANKCPVHRTLASEIDVPTRLVRAGAPR